MQGSQYLIDWLTTRNLRIKNVVTRRDVRNTLLPTKKNSVGKIRVKI